MLLTHHSNHMESLLEALGQVLAELSPDPFVARTIVVQNQGMARWLAQGLAERDGIAANLDFPLPASFFWRLGSAWLDEPEDASAFAKDVIAWRVLKLLPELLGQPEFSELAAYVADDGGGLKHWQLAMQIAETFDQYLVYRADLLLEWEGSSQARHWQAELWRRLVTDASSAHRAQVFRRLLHAMHHQPPKPGVLPQQVLLFGINSLAPQYLQMLGALARHVDVHLFYLNPCQEYWADLVDERGQLMRRAKAKRAGLPDPGGLLDLGNPLLASFGHAGQMFLDQLLELGGEDLDLFTVPAGSSLLAQLQADILMLVDRREQPGLLAEADGSLRIHGAHSALREVQILHDRLLLLFDTLPKLEPRQILVMAPDMASYAPWVDAVFGAASQFIPWQIADSKPEAGRALLHQLRALLNLPGSRFEATEVMSLIELPAVAKRFELSAEDIDGIRRWVQDSGIRWGLDAGMRGQVGLPPEHANTWAFGLQRLLLGYALPMDAATLCCDVLPSGEVEGSSAATLGTLVHLIDLLGAWRERLSQPYALVEWQSHLAALLQDWFLAEGEELALLQEVQAHLARAIEQAGLAGFDQPLSLAQFNALMQPVFDMQEEGARFLAGGVNFCNLVPMRSLPFRVICLLGMNGSDYPRMQRSPSFDLIAQQPRRGDRSRRQDDLYLFLEALLSARDHLHLSYISRDERDDSERQPSVAISALLDYVDAAYRGADGRPASEKLYVQHPLQPFSRAYFTNARPELFSYDQNWLSAALVQPKPQGRAFCAQPLARADERFKSLNLDELVQFFENPARVFLQQRLGLALPWEQAQLEDQEPFALDALTSYGLDQELLHALLQGQPAEAIEQRLNAEGCLPLGAGGELWLQDHVANTQPLADRIRALGEVGASQPLLLELDGYRIQASLSLHNGKQLVSYRNAKLKPKDLLRLWIKHLVASAVLGDAQLPSIHLASDQLAQFTPVQQPQTLLSELLQLRWQGLHQPLPFFINTCWDYVQDKSWWTAWAGNDNLPGDCADRYVAIAFADLDQPDEASWALAKQILQPLRDNLQMEKAGAKADG